MEDIGCRGRKYVVTKMIFFEVYYFILYLKKKENHKFSNARGCSGPYGAVWCRAITAVWNILFRIFYRKGAIQIINFIIIMYGAELL